MSNSVRPHRRQPMRLPRPWDSPGKNTGVGCHFLLQYMKVKSESEVSQSCPTLSDPMDCNPPGSSNVPKHTGVEKDLIFGTFSLNSTMTRSYLSSHHGDDALAAAYIYLVWEDPREKGITTHSSILAEKFHVQRRLAGCSPQGLKESDTTERLHTHTHTQRVNRFGR